MRKRCKVAPEPLTNTDVYGFTSRSILWREVVELIVRIGVSVSLGGASPQSLSKRAPSTTRTSLHLESITYRHRIEPAAICALIVPSPCRSLHIF